MLSARPPGQRCVSRGEPAARSGAQRVTATQEAFYVACRGRDHRAAAESSRTISASASQSLGARRSRGAAACARRASGCGISTAARCESGWTRWILEQFEFPFDARLRAGARRRQPATRSTTSLVFVDGAIPRRRRRTRRARRRRGGAPAAHRHPRTSIAPQVGRVSADRTIPQLREFVENGGTVIAIGNSGDESRRLADAAGRGSPDRERRAAAASEVLRPGIGAVRQRSTSPIRSPRA